MPFENIFPGLPVPVMTVVIYAIGFIGALALSYAVLLEAEKWQDAVFVLAAALLFVYGLGHGDKILIFTGALLFLVAGRELIQILRGKHHHSTGEVKEYKKE